MTDPDARIRAALGRLLQRLRVPSVPAWVDQAVDEIREAIPSGTVTADTPEAAAALVALKQRADGMEALAREMHGGFKQGGNGYSQRVSADTYEGWREGLRIAGLERETRHDG
jgi:hypothetical protein